MVDDDDVTVPLTNQHVGPGQQLAVDCCTTGVLRRGKTVTVTVLQPETINTSLLTVTFKFHYIIIFAPHQDTNNRCPIVLQFNNI